MSALTIKEAAAIAKCSETRLRQCIAAGKLAATREKRNGGLAFVITRDALSVYMALPDGRKTRHDAQRAARMAAALLLPPKPKTIKWADAEPHFPPGFKHTIIPAPAPRNQVVSLPSDHRPVIRSGAMDYKQHQYRSE